MSANHTERRDAPLPPAVVQALTSPALNDIWLHLLQPLPDERTAHRHENAAGAEPAAREGGR